MENDKIATKNYEYILENKCIYCGGEPVPFLFDHESDKLCRLHEKFVNETRQQNVISNMFEYGRRRKKSQEYRDDVEI